MKKQELPIEIKDNRLILDSEGHSPIEEHELEEVCDIIRATTSILHVSLKLRGVDTIKVTKLFFAILDSEGQISLNLDSNEVNDDGAFVLLNVIGRLPYFVQINISNNRITESTVERFAAELEKFKYGAYISLSTPLSSGSACKELLKKVEASTKPICVVTRKVTMKNAAFIIREISNDVVTEAIKDAFECLDVSETESTEEQTEKSTSNAYDNDDKPGDSMGGGAIREQNKESKPVSIFFSSEPELLDLHLEGVIQNETKEEKEYRESLEGIAEGLIYEVRKSGTEESVEIDNSTEEALPYIQDVPVTKVTGSINILNQIHS